MTKAEKESVDYQIRTKILDLTVDIAEARYYSLTRDKQGTAMRLLIFAEAIDYKRWLTSAQIDSVYVGMMDTANINDYPVAPAISTPPSQVVRTDATSIDYNAYDVKDAIADADYFSFLDSVVTKVKKTTWSNLKSLFQVMIDNERANKFNVSTNPPSGTPVEGEEWVVYTA